MSTGIILFACVAQGLLFFIHYVFYKFGVAVFPSLGRNAYVFGSIMTFLSLSFMASMFLVRTVENSITRTFYHGASIWMGTVIWLLLAIVAGSIIRLIVSDTSLVYNLLPKILICAAFLISIYGIFHGRDTVIVKRDISLANLPDAWEGKKAVFIADTHYGSIHTYKQAQKDVKLISSLNPDILLVSGDFFDGAQEDLGALAMPYKELKPTYGKFIASGNHETYAGLPESITALDAADFTILDNSHILIDGIEFSGVPYTTNGKSEIDDSLTAKASETTVGQAGAPHILLKHVPIATDVMRNAKVSFAFFGHTHRGQMWPISLIVKSIYGVHAYGASQEDDTQFYTTSGVGSWGPPQRIGTNSEMLLVTFRKK